MNRKTPMSNFALVPLVSLVVLASSCVRPDLHRIVQSNAPTPAASPRVLAVYMPWFGDHGHMDVGYSSQDPAVLRRQIEEARSLGISGFVVDWYGDRRPFLDKSFAQLQQVAVEQHFQVALLYNEPEDSHGEATDAALQALDKAYRDYIGPNAPYRESYLTHEGRPMIFIFPKNSGTDWGRVRQTVSSWKSPPLILYKDGAPPAHAADFDGYYAWIHPSNDHWAKDGSDWGKAYLERFYKNMRDQHPGKIAVGAAWPGFDDEHASWGLDRYMASRCGKTLEDTLRLFRRYYDEADPLPFLLIETWNDYEEGTAIEKPELRGCSGNPQNGGTRDVGR